MTNYEYMWNQLKAWAEKYDLGNTIHKMKELEETNESWNKEHNNVCLTLDSERSWTGPCFGGLKCTPGKDLT